MATIDRATILNDLKSILEDLRDDWEVSDEITEKTGFFKDLGFESIDAVALGSSIEAKYNRPLPFAEFLTKAGERKATDIYIGELVDFLSSQLNK